MCSTSITEVDVCRWRRLIWFSSEADGDASVGQRLNGGSTHFDDRPLHDQAAYALLERSAALLTPQTLAERAQRRLERAGRHIWGTMSADKVYSSHGRSLPTGACVPREVGGRECPRAG